MAATPIHQMTRNHRFVHNVVNAKGDAAAPATRNIQIICRPAQMFLS